jgi:hypothetical protein
MTYPLDLQVDAALTGRNRLTTAFRLILAIPHLILVGGGIGISWNAQDQRGTGDGGLLGAVCVVLAIVSWFTILFGSTHIAGIRWFTAFYLRWRARALAYVLLLVDPYPPFGDAEYPVSLTVSDPTAPRDRLSVAIRLILAIPHILVLVCLMVVACFTTIIAWFAILFTGSYPAGLYEFAVGVLRWRMRVDGYLLLMTDEYPPFSL